LNHGAHRAIDDHDAFTQKLLQRESAFAWLTYFLTHE
jgi:hypothetical protein